MFKLTILNTEDGSLMEMTYNTEAELRSSIVGMATQIAKSGWKRCLAVLMEAAKRAIDRGEFRNERN